jgi:hypothetical protein
MEAKKQLRKPEHWDDFESLCKKLWGEVWDCKEIKKNGRKGQIQNGVDIYGIPKGENSYYGIQCKGKDEYSHKHLSENEVDREIDLAKSFTPHLAKLYFATTANKDSKIEQYIRIKDLENRQKGLFEIHLFSWEDIVDLIDENKETHDWYLNLQKYKGAPDVFICFENEDILLNGQVPFCEKYTHYRVETSSKTSLWEIYSDIKKYQFQPDTSSKLFQGENKSYFRFRLKIKNTGNIPIENPKLVIRVNGNYQDIDDESLDDSLIPQKVYLDTKVDKKYGEFTVTPRRSALALEEEYTSNTLCIKPNIEGSDLELSWKLVSNNFNKKGLLKLKIDSFLIKKEVEEYVDFKQHAKTVKSIEDYFEEDEW